MGQSGQNQSGQLGRLGQKHHGYQQDQWGQFLSGQWDPLYQWVQWGRVGHLTDQLDRRGQLVRLQDQWGLQVQ
jgi:hypothetical protein